MADFVDVDAIVATENSDENVKKLAAATERNAEYILYEVLPARVQKLSQWHQAIPVSSEPVPIPSLLASPLNSPVTELHQQLKAELLFGLRCMDTLKMWIRFYIPRIQDGNNFGVAVQEEIVELLRAGRQSTMNALEACHKYHSTRAKIVSKIIKHPRVIDFALTLADMDEKEWLVLRNKNNYAIIYDTITKNLGKLKKPRGSGGQDVLMY